MTDYTNALARLLMQQQQPQDEFVADYASSAPLAANPGTSRHIDASLAMMHGLGGAMSAGMGPLGLPFLLGNIYMGGQRLNDSARATQQVNGTHPDQALMDRQLQEMARYGRR